MPITTTFLNDGTLVLAKTDKYGIGAKTFANRTQAERAATKFGGEVIHFRSNSPFYVRLPLSTIQVDTTIDIEFAKREARKAVARGTHVMSVCDVCGNEWTVLKSHPEIGRMHCYCGSPQTPKLMRVVEGSL